MMKSTLLGNLLVVQDQDLRKSLYPISIVQHQRRFTQFVRHRQTELSQPKQKSQMQNHRRDFNPNVQKLQNKFSLGQIMQRYHDESFVAKPRQLSRNQKIIHNWSKLIGKILQQDRQERIFRKDSNYLLLWNFMVLYSYIFNLFEIPIAMFFTDAVYQDQYYTAGGLILNWFAIIVILINILIVRPNTQFQNLGYLISNRREIMQNYFGMKLILDIVGFIVLFIYAVSYNSKLIYLKVLFYLDIFTLFDIDAMVVDKIQLKTFSYATYKLARLLVFMLVVLFWLSSIFFYIDYQYYIKGQQGYTNWLTYAMCAFQVIDGTSYGTDIIQQYPQAWYIWLNYAIYWALQTISTVGYGDITPRNPVSVTFTNISILIMMFFFVYFINTIIEIIDEMTSSEEKQKKSNIKNFKLYYMNAKQKLGEIGLKYNYSKQEIDNSLLELEKTSNDIRSYLYEMDINNLIDDDQNVEQMVNKNLNIQLKDELFLNYRQMFFKKVQLFGQIAKISDNFIQVYQKLIYKIKQTSYGSNQIIFFKDQPLENSLYYLLKGKIQISYPSTNYKRILAFKPVQEDAQPSSQTFYNFGVRQFFTKQMRTQNAITLSYCKIQELQYSDFYSIIRQQRDFYMKYCQLRDNIAILRSTNLCGQECFQCGSKKHHLFNCQKCVFNFRIHIKRQWENSFKIIVNEVSAAKCSRVPFYYRDRIISTKVNPKRMMIRKRLPEDIVLISKYYKAKDNLTEWRRGQNDESDI